jgi:hypothetical protein
MTIEISSHEVNVDNTLNQNITDAPDISNDVPINGMEAKKQFVDKYVASLVAKILVSG